MFVVYMSNILARLRLCIRITVHRRRLLSKTNHQIINLEDQGAGLGGQVDGARRHQQRLQHIQVVHIAHHALLHIDPRPLDTLGGVHAPQLRHDLDGLHPGILRQREGHHLERFGEGLDAVRVHPRHPHGGILEAEAGLDLRRAAAGDEGALLDEAPHDALRVVDGAVGLLEDQVVRAAEEDRHGPAGILDAGELDDLVAAAGHDDVADVLGGPELVGRHGIGVGDGRAAEGAADELDVRPLDVGDDQDAHLGQEVEAELVVGVAEDGLLDENDVGAGLLDLLALAEDVLALVAEDAVHGGVVGNDDVVVHVGLGGREAELEEGDLGVGNLRRPAGGLGAALGEDEAVDQLGVVDGPAHLLDHPDVAQVDVGRRRGVVPEQAEDGVDGDGGQEVGVLRHDLGGEAGVDGRDEGGAVG
mmetsp:Transcript_30154/g.88179  ORF Transcript_30154/g.88179 Transcript_30154/m.88179 type:complete len:417 (+) Transcript_30154:3697-4947(+)